MNDDEKQPVAESTPDWDDVAKRLGTTEVEQYRELAYRSQYRCAKQSERVTVALRLDPEMVKALDAFSARVWSEMDRTTLSRMEAMHVSGMSRQAAIRWILHRYLDLGDSW